MPTPTNPQEQTEAERLAGWDTTRFGPAPFEHDLPPAIDPALGHNGVPAPVAGDPDFTGGS